MFRNSLIFMTLFLALASVQGAEDEIVLLNLDDQRISPIEPIADSIVDANQAMRLIGTYHQLLDIEVRSEVEALHRQIMNFIPGFEVAYTAADSAEIAHIMSEIDLRLATLQNVHAQNYTQDVVELLSEAYQLILPTFGDEQ